MRIDLYLGIPNTSRKFFRKKGGDVISTKIIYWSGLELEGLARTRRLALHRRAKGKGAPSTAD